MHEDVRHLVADAAEKDISRPGVELDASAHDGDDPFAVFYVEDILELVKDDAALALCGSCDDRIQHSLKRREVCRGPGIDGNGGGARVGVNGKRRSQPRKRLDHLLQESGSVLKPRESGCESAAEIGRVAHAEQVRMNHRDTLHSANRLEYERCLPHAPLALDNDVLAGFHVSSEDTGEFRSAAKVFAINSASVFERVHAIFRLTVLHYAV